MKNLHFGHVLGGAFLVAGTSIGAGMLALPVVSSLGGFFPSLAIYIITWAIMTAAGFLYLEISLNMKKDSNIISMASKYLGNKGKIFSWIVYLFLFYCLSISYTSTGGSFIQSIFNNAIPIEAANFLFIIIFGFFVYKGALSVDRINIFLIIGLAISYFLFILFGAKHINFASLLKYDLKHAVFALPVILISFGFQGIIPTLTYYMKKNVKKIKLSIIIGTTLAFFVYLIFELLILGIVPVEGKFGLREALIQGQTAIEPLKYYTKVRVIYSIGQFFSFFAITTSFLGISLGLFDFVADGFKLEKKGSKKILIALITFVPPLIVTWINPNLFLIALSYAGGIGGALLLVLLPTLMVWSSRYIQKDKKYAPQLFGGKPILVLMVLFVFFELTVEIIQEISRFFS